MNNLLIEALVSLGYREHPKDENKWVKPFAYSIFLFMIDTNTLSTWFYGANDKFSCWQSKIIEPEKDFCGYSSSISYSEAEMFHEGWFVQPRCTLGFISTRDKMFLIEKFGFK